MEEIRRDIYLNRLIERKENGLIKVITGIRRCGKSYLLFHIYYRYLLSLGVCPERIITISLDDEDYTEFRDSKKLNSYIKSKISDEVPLAGEDGETHLRQALGKLGSKPLLLRLNAPVLRIPEVDVQDTV